MAVTSGVRNVVGYLVLDAGNVQVLHAEATQTKKRGGGTFSALIAIDALPAGLDLSAFAGTMNGGVAVSTLAGGGDVTPLVTGEIDTVDIDMGNRIMTVSGRDKAKALHDTKSSEKFSNKTPQQIIQDVAGRAGLSPSFQLSGDASLLAGKLNQIEWAKMTEDTSLASIVHKLSEFLGAHWYVKGSQLVVTDQEASGGYVVNYSPPLGGGPATGDFISLKIKRNLQLSKSITTEVKGWHSQKKQVITSTQTKSGSGSGSLTYRYRIPNVTQDHADKHAKSALKDHARHEITISLEMVGDPSIDISQGLQLNGTQGFDQSYDIDSIAHSVSDSGYRMTIEAKASKGGGGSSSGSSSGGGGSGSSSGGSGGAIQYTGSDSTGSGVANESYPLTITA